MADIFQASCDSSKSFDKKNIYGFDIILSRWLLQEVFGDMLLTAQIDKSETMLPSPEKLKRRIILKHKKLPEGHHDETVLTSRMSSMDATADNVHGMDISNSIHSGTLLLQDQGKFAKLSYLNRKIYGSGGKKKKILRKYIRPITKVIIVNL